MLNAIENAIRCQMAEVLDRAVADDANVSLTTYRTDILKNIVISCMEIYCYIWSEKTINLSILYRKSFNINAMSFNILCDIKRFDLPNATV